MKPPVGPGVHRTFGDHAAIGPDPWAKRRGSATSSPPVQKSFGRALINLMMRSGRNPPWSSPAGSVVRRRRTCRRRRTDGQGDARRRRWSVPRFTTGRHHPEGQRIGFAAGHHRSVAVHREGIDRWRVTYPGDGCQGPTAGTRPIGRPGDHGREVMGVTAGHHRTPPPGGPWPGRGQDPTGGHGLGGQRPMAGEEMARAAGHHPGGTRHLSDGRRFTNGNTTPVQSPW